jgi:hypothetical protein
MMMCLSGPWVQSTKVSDSDCFGPFKNVDAKTLFLGQVARQDLILFRKRH